MSGKFLESNSDSTLNLLSGRDSSFGFLSERTSGELFDEKFLITVLGRLEISSSFSDVFGFNYFTSTGEKTFNYRLALDIVFDFDRLSV